MLGDEDIDTQSAALSVQLPTCACQE